MTIIDQDEPTPLSDFDAVIDSASFLSRLPLHKVVTARAPDFTQITHCFSLAGLIITLPAVLVFILGLVFSLPAFVIAILILITQALTTGGLHEDGLADTVDGFGGGDSAQRKLEIMRDSSIGTYGVLALLFSIAIKIALLSSLIDTLHPQEMIFVLLGVAGLSRLAMLWPWKTLPSARQSEETTDTEKDADSLAIKHGAPGKALWIKPLLFALPAFLLVIFGGYVVQAFIAIALAIIATLILARLAKKQIGGYTGDVLGATQQVAEIALYLGLLMVI